MNVALTSMQGQDWEVEEWPLKTHENNIQEAQVQAKLLSCEHVSVNKWAQVNLLMNILLTLTKYFLTHKTKYSMTWWNILHVVMDEWFVGWKWMINNMDELL